jgi:murein DD-endopeptidase MepM/ murein hydrolase activator NlpD
MKNLLAVVTAAIVGLGSSTLRAQQDQDSLKGYDITPTGLTPVYPPDMECSPLTSLYASWVDVDGSRRDEPHSGVDGGRLRDPILAPGPGTVRAVWKADWGWGREGALLILHTREELGLQDGPAFYYSEFDHLTYREASTFKIGQRIARGEPLAHVSRPGGKERYLEEVHWEVWEVDDDAALKWRRNDRGTKFWTNSTARLIDPLYMLSRQNPPHEDGTVVIIPYVKGEDYQNFKGFTYILPCQSRSAKDRRRERRR